MYDNLGEFEPDDASDSVRIGFTHWQGDGWQTIIAMFTVVGLTDEQVRSCMPDANYVQLIPIAMKEDNA